MLAVRDSKEPVNRASQRKKEEEDFERKRERKRDKNRCMSVKTRVVIDTATEMKRKVNYQQPEISLKLITDDRQHNASLRMDKDMSSSHPTTKNHRHDSYHHTTTHGPRHSCHQKHYPNTEANAT